MLLSCFALLMVQIPLKFPIFAFILGLNQTLSTPILNFGDDDDYYY